MSTLFYRNPVLINSARHAATGLRDIDDFGFARAANAIPVNLVEFALAARRYPLAFVGDVDPYPAAIVGLKDGNLFIDAAGAWKSDCYVPAYVRRYPFIFADDKDRGLLSLCVDEEVLTGDGGRRLFEDEKPTPFTNQALEFCKDYHAAALSTQAFAKAVVEQDLLTERQATARLKDGDAYVLTGFRVIDEEKLRALSGEVLADWNAKGWLKALFAMVQSSVNWGDLADLLATNGPPPVLKTRKTKN